MSKNDYDKLSAAIAESNVEADLRWTGKTKAAVKVALGDVIGRIAKALGNDNPNFQYDRFFAACYKGVTKEKR